MLALEALSVLGGSCRRARLLLEPIARSPVLPALVSEAGCGGKGSESERELNALGARARLLVTAMPLPVRLCTCSGEAGTEPPAASEGRRNAEATAPRRWRREGDRVRDCCSSSFGPCAGAHSSASPRKATRCARPPFASTPPPPRHDRRGVRHSSRSNTPTPAAQPGFGRSASARSATAAAPETAEAADLPRQPAAARPPAPGRAPNAPTSTRALRRPSFVRYLPSGASQQEAARRPTSVRRSRWRCR